MEHASHIGASVSVCEICFAGVAALSPPRRPHPALTGHLLLLPLSPCPPPRHLRQGCWECPSWPPEPAPRTSLNLTEPHRTEFLTVVKTGSEGRTAQVPLSCVSQKAFREILERLHPSYGQCRSLTSGDTASSTLLGGVVSPAPCFPGRPGRPTPTLAPGRCTELHGRPAVHRAGRHASGPAPDCISSPSPLRQPLCVSVRFGDQCHGPFEKPSLECRPSFPLSDGTCWQLRTRQCRRWSPD